MSSLSHTADSQLLSVSSWCCVCFCLSLSPSRPLLPPLRPHVCPPCLFPLLPCRWVHQCHLPRSHMLVLPCSLLLLLCPPFKASSKQAASAYSSLQHLWSPHCVPGTVPESLLSLSQLSKIGAIIIPILQMRKERHRKVKYLTRSYKASKC